jgi:hypothetical protein
VPWIILKRTLPELHPTCAGGGVGDGGGVGATGHPTWGGETGTEWGGEMGTEGGEMGPEEQENTPDVEIAPTSGPNAYVAVITCVPWKLVGEQVKRTP